MSEDLEGDYISQQPCRGTVNIGNVQLPLKVEFVCSSRNRTGMAATFKLLLPLNIAECTSIQFKWLLSLFISSFHTNNDDFSVHNGSALLLYFVI